VLHAADIVAQRADNDLQDKALRQPHLVPELLPLSQQTQQLPMPAWRAVAQAAQSQYLTVQHVALRQAIAEQNHYTVLATSKPMQRGALISADHAASRDATKVSKRVTRRTRPQLARKAKSALARRRTNKATKTTKTQLNACARLSHVSLSSPFLEHSGASGGSPGHGGAVGKPSKRRWRRTTKSTKADTTARAVLQPEITCRSGSSDLAERVAAAGLHALSDGQVEHIASDHVIREALQETAVQPEPASARASVMPSGGCGAATRGEPVLPRAAEGQEVPQAAHSTASSSTAGSRPSKQSKHSCPSSGFHFLTF
jgi:hypothetical protein